MIEITSYTELIEAIKARIAELGIKYENFDDLAWFSPGMSGKVFGPSQVKRLGTEKLFDALRAASLKISVEPDPAQLEKMRKQMAEHVQIRHTNQARYNNHSSPAGTHMMSRVFKHLSKLGGKARMSQMSKSELRSHQQAASNARWKKHRKRQKAAKSRKNRLRLQAAAVVVGEVAAQ